MTFQQKFIRFSQIVLIIGGVILWVAPASLFPSYYRPMLMGTTAFLYSFFIYLPVFIFPNASTPQRLRARDRLQAALSLGFLLGSLGSLGLWGLYTIGIPYDKGIHFLFSGMMVFSGVAMFQMWKGWSLKKSLLVVALIVGFSGVVWEFVEFFSKGFLHFGYFGHLFDYDSVHDILANLLGIVGASILWAWYAYHNRRYKH